MDITQILKDAIQNKTNHYPLLDDNITISDMTTTLNQLLTDIENTIALQSHRRPIPTTIYPHCDDILLSLTPTQQQEYRQIEMRYTPEEQSDKGTTYHIHFVGQEHTRISYKPNDLAKLVRDQIHESEHENQTSSLLYSDEQRKMIWISRAFYTEDTASPVYLNNYTEIFARLAEAKAVLTAYHSLKNDLTFKADDMVRCAKQLDDVYQHLTQNTSLQQALKINQKNILQVFTNPMLAQKLQFMEATADIHMSKFDVLSFLISRAPQLLREAFEEVNKTAKEIQDIHTQLQRATTTDLVQTKAQDSINERLLLCQSLKIPIKQPTDIATSNCEPLNSPWIDLTLSVVQQKYNVSLTFHPEMGWCLCYDDKPPHVRMDANANENTHEQPEFKEQLPDIELDEIDIDEILD